VNTRSGKTRFGTIAVALSTALVLVALAIVPFLNPTWVAFEQGRTGAAVLSGFSETQLRTATDAILDDLVTGAGDFDVELAGVPVLVAPERAHMRDVRGVFASFFAAAAVAVAILGGAFWLAGRRGASTWTRREAWRAVRFGAIGLGAAIAVAGVIALVAFDPAFEVFHRLIFAQGTYLFDPRTSRLVQLFPDAFWSETSIAVGATVLAFTAATAWLAGRRLRRRAPTSTRSPEAEGSTTLAPADAGRAR
jgi:integral membrane protein (TIGR01906 family)